MNDQLSKASIKEFGGGNDLAGQAFRELWVARTAGSPVRFAQSFLSKAPDSLIDYVIEQVEASAAELRCWPANAVLELGIEGDSGSYCEDDGRSAVLTLKLPANGTTKTFKTSCEISKFQQSFTNNLARVTKLIRLM